ncbi:adenylate cyclase [Listeria newyorkensis]|uniref:Adenylate cyclase n=1 Tax=Listeria newyorkensis TaxID=1497681 RepID=A0ABX4XPC1_9LIST|nr:MULTISPECIES: CYTH domain-containing protein [Listeria]KGL39533.1 adenylate cyclase [Listeriaceae bacterium FSL A5-0209]KGL44196.1 adenylate cyclase [Listeria newyorkensis]KMT59524.1 adenylate cyclase [Listeria newyorkensis]PNP93084.1 adenylate cyclase [Listeria newyorkensis]RQW67080.1 CYTH domain-containing protein [Listeria sp. SHR_NRA_18]
MSQELEIEFKNMLTASEYDLLVHEFRLEESDFFTQTNYYFDTADFQLKDRLAALRIRKRELHYELTLKTPEQIGLLETTQILAEEQVTAILDGANIPVGQVRDALHTLSIDHEDLVMFGSLTTTRAEKEYKKGLLVFDKSFYSDTHDFELEYEVADFEKGKVIFHRFLEEREIPQRPTKNKILRFYEAVYKEK